MFKRLGGHTGQHVEFVGGEQVDQVPPHRADVRRCGVADHFRAGRSWGEQRAAGVVLARFPTDRPRRCMRLAWRARRLGDQSSRSAGSDIGFFLVRWSRAVVHLGIQGVDPDEGLQGVREVKGLLLGQPVKDLALVRLRDLPQRH